VDANFQCKFDKSITMRVIPIFVFVFLFFSCNKDKFTTKPQLRFKSANATTISGNEVLSLKFDLTDKEGDFTPFLGYKKTVAGCPASNRTDSTSFSIPPDFIDTKATQGELVITFTKNLRGSNSCLLPGGAVRPDTSVFSFWTRDKAGNKSDTSYSAKIIILN
jgi:hypothetical protein